MIPPLLLNGAFHLPSIESSDDPNGSFVMMPLHVQFTNVTSSLGCGGILMAIALTGPFVTKVPP
jgi:hypothetical protein